MPADLAASLTQVATTDCKLNIVSIQKVKCKTIADSISNTFYGPIPLNSGACRIYNQGSGATGANATA